MSGSLTSVEVHGAEPGSLDPCHASAHVRVSEAFSEVGCRGPARTAAPKGTMTTGSPERRPLDLALRRCRRTHRRRAGGRRARCGRRAARAARTAARRTRPTAPCSARRHHLRRRATASRSRSSACTPRARRPGAERVRWLLDQQCANGGFSAPRPAPQPAPRSTATYTGGNDTQRDRARPSRRFAGRRDRRPPTAPTPTSRSVQNVGRRLGVHAEAPAFGSRPQLHRPGADGRAAEHDRQERRDRVPRRPRRWAVSSPRSSRARPAASAPPGPAARRT